MEIVATARPDSEEGYLAVTEDDNERVYATDLADPNQAMVDITDWTTVEFARYVDEWRARLTAQTEETGKGDE